MLQPDVTTASFGEEEQLDEDEEREKQAELQSFLNAASEEAGNLWDASFSTLGDDDRNGGRNRDFDYEHGQEAIMTAMGQPTFGEQYLSRQPVSTMPHAPRRYLVASPPVQSGAHQSTRLESVAVSHQHHAAVHESPPRSNVGRSPPQTRSLPSAVVNGHGLFDPGDLQRSSQQQALAYHASAALSSEQQQQQHQQQHQQQQYQQQHQQQQQQQQHPAWRDMATSSSDYQVSQLSSQLVKQQQDNQQLQQKFLDVQQELEKQKRLSHHYLELQKQETANIQSQLEQSQSRAASMETENQVYRQKLSDAMQTLERALQEKTEAVDQMQSLKSNISTLQVQLQQVSSSHSLTRHKEEHDQQLEQLREKQRTELAYQQQLVDSANSKLAKEQSSVHRLEAEVAVLKSEIQQLRSERDQALRRLSCQSELNGRAALSDECAEARAACRVAERQCEEFKAEVEAVRDQLRNLPCWQQDDNGMSSVPSIAMGNVSGSLMVTPGALQHSTPMTNASGRPQGSCRDIVALLSLKMKRLQEVARRKPDGSQSAPNLAQLNEKEQEISSLHQRLRRVEAERDALALNSSKLQSSQASSNIVEAELKAKIEALQEELRKQWHTYEEDKKTSLESFYSQLMDLHGNSSQRLKERMQMVSSAERQNLLVSHAQEISALRSELLAAQSEGSRVKEEFIRMSESCQKEKRDVLEHTKKAQNIAIESLQQSHKQALHQCEERHRQQLTTQLAAVKEQHMKEREATSDSRVSLMETQLRTMTDFDSVLSSRLSEQERRLQGRHEEAMTEMQQQLEALRLAAGSGMCSEEMLGRMRTRLLDELQREREGIIRPALEQARQQWNEEQQSLLVKLESEATSQRLTLLQQLSDKSKARSESSTQTDNGPVLLSMNKHLTQDLMKVAVELFHKCIREWEARQRIS